MSGDVCPDRPEAYAILATNGRQVDIVGRDDLGVVYGILHFSRHVLRVEPFWFWADLPPQARDEIEMPAVDYVSRGLLADIGSIGTADVDPSLMESGGLMRGTPVSGKIVAALSPEYSEGDKKGVEFMNKVAPDAQKFVNDPVGYGNFKNDYKLIVEKIQFGTSTPEQAYEELLKKADEYAAAATKK